MTRRDWMDASLTTRMRWIRETIQTTDEDFAEALHLIDRLASGVQSVGTHRRIRRGTASRSPHPVDGRTRGRKGNGRGGAPAVPHVSTAGALLKQ
jgi:hypothetical protein